MTDGTAADTRPFADLTPGPQSSNQLDGVALPDRRCVATSSLAAYGMEPFASDPAGTTLQLLADVAPGPANPDPSLLAPWHGEAWFAADTPSPRGGPRRTDGTVAGTRPGDPTLGQRISRTSLPVAGNRLYFRTDTTHPALWDQARPEHTGNANPRAPVRVAGPVSVSQAKSRGSSCSR
ncbi:MAG: hypothetical protein IPM29_07390 [Planctomycetes bacterium]|nr:hypothetical protein [Planctomycetota bacterium]